MRGAGASYGGWLPNHRVPEVFARFAVTVHVPRRPYVRALPGIPTIRVFEALACGIPLVSAPWNDGEGLFTPDDMLFAADGEQMTRHLRAVLAEPDLAKARRQWSRHDQAAAYLRPPGRPAARHLRRARSVRQTRACPRSPDAHRVLRLQPGIGLLERRRHLLPWPARGARRPRSPVAFYEPDAFERQAHRDIDDPDWAEVVVYRYASEAVMGGARRCRGSGCVVKASGVGVYDDEFSRPGRASVAARPRGHLLGRGCAGYLEARQCDLRDPFRALIPQYDLVLTYGGGEPVVTAY